MSEFWMYKTSFLFPLLPQIFDFRTFRNKCGGVYTFILCLLFLCQEYLLWWLYSTRRFTSLLGAPQKEVPRVREKQYTMPVLPYERVPGKPGCTFHRICLFDFPWLPYLILCLKSFSLPLPCFPFFIAWITVLFLCCSHITFLIVCSPTSTEAPQPYTALNPQNLESVQHRVRCLINHPLISIWNWFQNLWQYKNLRILKSLI